MILYKHVFVTLAFMRSRQHSAAQRRQRRTDIRQNPHYTRPPMRTLYLYPVELSCRVSYLTKSMVLEGIDSESKKQIYEGPSLRVRKKSTGYGYGVRIGGRDGYSVDSALYRIRLDIRLDNTYLAFDFVGDNSSANSNIKFSLRGES